MQALRRLLRDILQIGGIAVALHCGGTPLDERVATVVAAKVAADKKVQEALDMGNAADESQLDELQDEQRQDDEEKAATGAHFQQHFRGASICFNSHPVLSP